MSEANLSATNIGLNHGFSDRNDNSFGYEDWSVTTATATATTTSQVLVDVSYVLNKENKWGWITLYVVTIVIAVLGNLLFLIACACTKRTRTTGYYLLINLSLRDILVASLCVPFALDSEIISLSWQLGNIYCICYRYFYYCFLFFLPLTLLFLAFHLFVENCKWNFAGEDGFVPRPWPHTIFIPLIWFFSAAFAVPTVFWSDVRNYNDDFYRNTISNRPQNATVCMHIGTPSLEGGSNFFYIASTIVTFCIPVLLLILPWFALFVQVCACCSRKLRNSEFWLSIITLFLILIWEASRAPFELFNFHHILTTWKWDPLLPLNTFLPLKESYKAVMKWAIFAPALLHPLVYFIFSPEARHGIYILFTRMCSCCCSKSASDELEHGASDDEKGQMLQHQHNPDDQVQLVDEANVPLQSKQEDEIAIIHHQHPLTPSKILHRKGEANMPLLQAAEQEASEMDQQHL